MRWGGWVRGAGAASVLLLIAGCVSAPAAPRGLTPSEQAEYRADQLDQYWATAQFSRPHDRPTVAPGAFVSIDDWPDLMNACIDEANVEDANNWFTYTDSGGQASYMAGVVGDRVQLANYVCHATYVVEPIDYGMLSDDQKTALYRYFQTWLVPCLESRGHHITDIPSADLFQDAYSWNPYTELVTVTGRFQAPDRAQLVAACPPYPGWYPFPADSFPF